MKVLIDTSIWSEALEEKTKEILQSRTALLINSIRSEIHISIFIS